MEIFKISSGSGGGSEVEVDIFQENFTITAGNDTLEISVNSGVLPTDDAAILLSSATGVVQQGVNANQYQIDRVSSPNQLILNTPIVTGSLDFVVFFIIPT